MVLAIAALMLGTLPDIARGNDLALTVLALVLSLLFGLEYAARLAVASRAATADDVAHPIRRCLAWMVSPLALIDLLAAIAVPAALAFGLPRPVCSASSGFSRRSGITPPLR
ncbi:MAG: hypothetical protein O3A96_08025 [Proteobacteria bacterium]|nr:hypothetical protein [Pseudomonadota bacterium]